jgi:uncharacterized membrane protein YbhN (UPF0104 family)
VLAFEVLEHIENDVDTLRTWRGYVKPGGTLVLSVPAHQRKWGAIDEWAGHVRRYERRDLAAKLVEAGFEGAQLRCYGFPATLLLDPLLNMRHRKPARLVAGLDAETRTRRSGVQRGRLTYLDVFTKEILFRPLAWLQRLFFDTDLGSGYVVTAQRPVPGRVPAEAPPEGAVPESRARWRRVAIAGYGALIAALIAWFFLRRTGAVLAHLRAFNPLYLLPSGVFLAAFLTAAAWNWSRIQKRVAQAVHPPRGIDWLRLFMYGYLGRYIPGKVPVVLGRILFLERHGYSKRAIALASVYENIFILTNGTLVGVLLLLLSPVTFPAPRGTQIALAMAVSAAAVAFLLSPVLPRVLRLVLRLARRAPLRDSLLLSSRDVLQALGLYTAVALLSGAAFHCFTAGVCPEHIALARLPYSIAAVNLAGVLGMLAVVVPAGLGVREGVLIGFLAAVMPLEAAALAAVGYRLFLTAGELAYAGAVELASRRAAFRRRRKEIA